jgi:hypothetical protein
VRVVKWVGVAFAIVALLTGLKAAWEWYKSSKITPDPGWGLDPTGTLPMQPADPMQAQMDWIVATLAAMRKASSLNATAACWTAVSVVLAGISAIFGSLSCG